MICGTKDSRVKKQRTGVLRKKLSNRGSIKLQVSFQSQLLQCKPEVMAVKLMELPQATEEQLRSVFSCTLAFSASPGTDEIPAPSVQALSVKLEALLAWPTALRWKITLLPQHYFLLSFVNSFSKRSLKLQW